MAGRGPPSGGVWRECAGAAINERAGLAARYLRVDHAGEFGATQIYRAQIMVARMLGRRDVALLEEFLAHERTHFATFTAILQRRGIRRCRSYHLCGIGGWLLGLVTGLLGTHAVMACTWSVEDVVNRHLQEQLAHLHDDADAHAAIASIVADELAHRDIAGARLAAHSVLRPVIHAVVAASTEAVIWLGMRL